MTSSDNYMISKMYSDLDDLVSRTPKFVTTWARRDVITFWIGRLVSPKRSYHGTADPNKIGVITEVGRVGWVGVLWEDGSEDGKWNRKELDDYQGPPNWECRTILVKGDNVRERLLTVIKNLDKSGVLRNGDLLPA